MTFGSHLRAKIFHAERSLSMKACWFKRNIPFFVFPHNLLSVHGNNNC